MIPLSRLGLIISSNQDHIFQVDILLHSFIMFVLSETLIDRRTRCKLMFQEHYLQFPHNLMIIFLIDFSIFFSILIILIRLSLMLGSRIQAFVVNSKYLCLVPLLVLLAYCTYDHTLLKQATLTLILLSPLSLFRDCCQFLQKLSIYQNWHSRQHYVKVVLFRDQHLTVRSETDRCL